MNLLELKNKIDRIIEAVKTMSKCDHTIGYEAQHGDWIRVRVSDVKKLKEENEYEYENDMAYSTSDDFKFCPDCGWELTKKHFV